MTDEAADSIVAADAARELPQGWRGMHRGGRFDPAVCKTLLVAFTVPLDAGLADDANPDDMADAIAQIVNEEWWRNTAHEPDYFEPLGVSILPCSPIWVTNPIMRVLKKASELIAEEKANG